jgi:hypothetical protein
MTIKFSVLYPKTEGATFDRDYYVSTHVMADMANYTTISPVTQTSEIVG